MTKSLFICSLCLLLLSHCLPAFADQFDDCTGDCRQNMAQCVEQAKISAGNIQEEQDMIASCDKNRAACIQACKDAEAQPPQPPQEQSQEQSQSQ